MTFWSTCGLEEGETYLSGNDPRYVQSEEIEHKITRKLHHWKLGKKMVACGLSNMRSAYQNYMNSSSIQNSKATMLCTSITSTTTSRCVSMRKLDSEMTFFLPTSLSKYSLSLKNTSSQIGITLPILGMHRPTLP